jgi:sec-independent protein translocase protein TatA
MFGLGMQELMVIMVIVLVLFGGSKLPQIGSGIGQAIRNFKEGVNAGDKTEIEDKKTS